MQPDRSACALLLGAMLSGCTGLAARESRGTLPAAPPAASPPSEPRGERAPTLGPDAGLDDYLRLAEHDNPGLQAAYQDWMAAREVPGRATAFPDPRIAYRYYLQEVETRVGPQEQSIGISQTLPWFGKRGMRGRMADEEALAARERYRARRLALRHEVETIYCELYYLGRAIEILRRNRDLVSDLEGVARIRYSGGEGDHPDVIRAQVELGKLEDQLHSLVDRKGTLDARMNAALGRGPGAQIPWPSSVPSGELEAGDATLLERALQMNPELRALDHGIARDMEAIHLAQRESFPDLTLGLDYIDTRGAITPGVPDDGKDAVLLGLSFDLPIQRGRRRAAEREARARHRADVLRRSELGNALQARTADALYRLRDSQRKISLYRDALIPRANQALAGTETAFRAGSASFFELVDAERLLLEFELAHQRALADAAQGRAELERLIGGELSPSEDSTP